MNVGDKVRCVKHAPWCARCATGVVVEAANEDGDVLVNWLYTPLKMEENFVPVLHHIPVDNLQRLGLLSGPMKHTLLMLMKKHDGKIYDDDLAPATIQRMIHLRDRGYIRDGLSDNGKMWKVNAYSPTWEDL